MFKSRCFAVLLLSISLSHAAELNKAAPSFTLKNQRKVSRTLADYKGKVVLINFWASWCAPCQEELPELKRLAGEYQGKNVNIVAINVDEDRNAAKSVLAKLGLSTSHLEILWDSSSKTVSAYNIDGMPTSFILDRQGTIRYIHSGFHRQDPSAWRQEINRLLS